MRKEIVKNLPESAIQKAKEYGNNLINEKYNQMKKLTDNTYGIVVPVEATPHSTP